MENSTKLRLIYLYQYLVNCSDKDHPVSTPEIIRYLKAEYDIDVNRITVGNDCQMMEKAGIPIRVIRSRQNRYYYDGRLFSVPELKILIDAVASSKVITDEKSRNLISKLTALTSEENAGKLNRHLTVEGRVKSENEQIFRILDIVNDAIDSKKKISFKYTEFNGKKRKVIKHDGEVYIVSPYSLVWDGDYYYLIGYCDNRKHTRNFRLDRIYKEPVLLKDDAQDKSKDFDVSIYSKRVFRMFDTDEPVIVELLCENTAMNAVVDKFGREVYTEVHDEDHFIVKVKVCSSRTFYGWLFGFAGMIKILSPESVADEFKKMAKMVINQ